MSINIEHTVPGRDPLQKGHIPFDAAVLRPLKIPIKKSQKLLAILHFINM